MQRKLNDSYLESRARRCHLLVGCIETEGGAADGTPCQQRIGILAWCWRRGDNKAVAGLVRIK